MDAASKVKSLLKNQRDGFEQGACEYKETARAIAAREVAEERAKIHTEANTAVSSRELQLEFEADQLREAKDLLAKAKKEVLFETSYKDQVFKEAEVAIRKTQTEAEQLAQSTLSQHRGQAEQMVQTLQGQIQTSEQALTLEHTQRAEAQSELASSKFVFLKSLNSP